MKCIYRIFCPHHGHKIRAKKRKRLEKVKENKYSDTNLNHFRLLEETNSPNQRTEHTAFGSLSTSSNKPFMPVMEVGLAPSGSDEVSALSLQSTNILHPHSPEVKAWLEQKERQESYRQEARNDEESRTVYTRAEI